MQKKLFQNIGFLTLSQIANYLLPLVTIPYVTRIVGPENFGLIEFAQSTLLYLIVVVNYGFNRTATRKIAARPEDEEWVSLIFSQVVVAKLILFISTIVLLFICIGFIPEFQKNALILIAGFPIVLGWAIYPSFLFEGLQRLGVNALAEVLIKTFAAVLILTLIREPEDYFMVPAINGFIQAVFGVITFMYAIKKVKGVKFIRPEWNDVKDQIFKGRFVFFSSFFNTINSFSTILFGAFLLTPFQLGIYAAAYKLIFVINSFLFRPLHGALFPYLAGRMTEGLRVFSKVFTRSLVYLVLTAFVASLITYFFAPLLIHIVFGSGYENAIKILRIMVPSILIGSFIHMYVQQGLLLIHRDKLQMFLIIAGGLVSLVLNYFLITGYELKGAAWARVLSDCIIAILAGIFYYKAFKQQLNV